MSKPKPSSPTGEDLSWDLNFLNNCTDEHGDSEILTTSVRTSYMNYIKKTLEKNYEQWLDSNQDNAGLKCSKELISRCANQLEHKALKSCMVARYYQQAMAKSIKEIKKSTEKGSLFSPLIENALDSKIKNQIEKGTQTRISLTNCTVQSPEYTKDTLKRQHIKEISNIDTIQDAITLNPSTTDKCDRGKGNKDLEDLINILTMSPNFSERNDVDKSPSPKRRNNEVVSIKDINFDNVSDLNKLSDSGYLGEKRNMSLDERIQEFAVMFGIDEYNSKHEVQENTNITHVKSLNRAIEGVSSTNNNDNMISKENTSFNLALDWTSENAAQNCNLKLVLAHLNPTKKEIVQKKFDELFGKEEPMDTEISLIEAAWSRKRTANLVVGALTPYYLDGKIGSRNVFKTLAKKITDEILQVTHAAGVEEVVDKVNTYLENGRCINSEEDIMNK